MPCTIGPCATSSPTRRRGLSEPYGSWNTICNRRAAACREIARRFTPPIVMVPASSGSRRNRQRASVLLPDPLSPTTPRVPPRGSVTLTSSSARTARRPPQPPAR